MLGLLLWMYLVGMAGCMIGINGLDIKPISDGIIVSRGANMSVIEGEWTLLLTIHEDGIIHGLRTHTDLVARARNIWNIVDGQNTSLFLTDDRKNLMKAKIGLVIEARPALTYNVAPTRDRRGVLDFVGTGLNWAFGTATQAQVDALQGAVDAAGATQRAIVHNVKELITVVNQTQQEGEDTRHRLLMLSASYDQFVSAENHRWNRFDQNTKLLMLEDYVNTLLWLDTAVWKNLNRIHMLHRSLRTGDLTEELCPITLLEEISRLAVTHGLRSLNANWYYENVGVKPLMIREGQMTFKVTLPYADNNVYQRYSIRTFAVPIDDHGLRARVAVQPDISIQTSTGSWFVPTSCQGHRPQLCRAGPRWKDAYPCERGLITGHQPDRKFCTIVTTNGTDTTAMELQEGLFVLQTLGENVRLACTGKIQEQSTLGRGTYTVGLSEGCILSGGRWALHGILRRFLTATTTLTQLEVPRLDLVALMRALPRLNDTDPLVDLNFDDIAHKYVPRYVGMNGDNDGYPEVIIAHHLSWASIGSIIVLCILCIIAAVWLYRRRQKIRFFFADALLTKVKAKQVEKAIRYSAKAPELVETVESATAGEIETV